MTGRAFLHYETAICNLGSTWPSIWQRLLQADRYITSASTLSLGLDMEVPVAAIPGLSRIVETTPPGFSAGARLTKRLLANLPSDWDWRQSTCFCGTNHGESDALLEFVRGAQAGAPGEKTSILYEALDCDPMIFHAIGVPENPEPQSLWSFSACTSGLHALVLACLNIKHARETQQSCLVFAVDALSSIGLAGFKRLGALSSDGCRPFCKTSDGILVGEGAAALRLSTSPPIGATGGIYIAGMGMTCDAGHVTAPNDTGLYLKKAIAKALASGGMQPRDIGAVVAHGTGTQINDRAESLALTEIFRPRGVPVTSIKGSIGHCMGASGLFNLLCAATALKESLLPPTWIGDADIRNDVDLVVTKPRAINPLKSILLLAAGFGGNNVAIILSKQTESR